MIERERESARAKEVVLQQHSACVLIHKTNEKIHYTTKILTINSNWLVGKTSCRRCVSALAWPFQWVIAIETLSHRNVCIKAKRSTEPLCIALVALHRAHHCTLVMRECDFISIVIVVIIIHARLKGIFLINSLIGIMDIWCIGSCQFYHYRWTIALLSRSRPLIVYSSCFAVFSLLIFCSVCSLGVHGCESQLAMHHVLFCIHLLATTFCSTCSEQYYSSRRFFPVFYLISLFVRFFFRLAPSFPSLPFVFIQSLFL